MSKESTGSDAPLGTLLGYAPDDMAIRPSDYNSLNPQDYPDGTTFRNYIGNEYMGYKQQCVEFARRFLFLTYGFVFTDAGMAYEIFSLRFLCEAVNDSILPLQVFVNGSRRPPIVGLLLIWQKGGKFKHTDHVAVITQPVGNKVRIAEQDITHSPLPQGQQWTRELTFEVSAGWHTTRDTFTDTEILGWMIQTVDTEHSLLQPVLPGEAMAIKGVRLPNNGQFRGKWLNEKDPLQKAYVAANGHFINQDPYQYLTINESTEQEPIKATNELHLMYLHATDKVMKDNNLLALFDTPRTFRPRLRPSWQHRCHHTITGCMDFCMGERRLKVYEYNVDSASRHTEGGLTLEQRLKQGYYDTDHNLTEGLLGELAGAWKHSRARPFVHIMQDKDLGENYHAKFIQHSLTRAGLESKILSGLDELRWDAAGQLIGADGRLTNCVWKTWAWETTIEQVCKVSADEYVAVPIRIGHPQNEMRLIDVLLCLEVLVFEPLWTVVPGSKVALPVLWSLFPHRYYLLGIGFVVSDELAEADYAAKLISGHYGNNIDLVGLQDEVLDKISGQFVDRKNIYQQLWCLPKMDGKYIQVCTFTVGGSYGGICLRDDSLLVVKKESGTKLLVVLEDKV